MPVLRILSLSSVHLPPGVYHHLDSEEGIVVEELNNGWLLPVPVDVDDFFDPDYTGPSPELLRVLRWAAKIDCAFVLFEGDGPRDGNLPAYER